MARHRRKGPSLERSMGRHMPKAMRKKLFSLPGQHRMLGAPTRNRMDWLEPKGRLATGIHRASRQRGRR
jgi:hypothetical protein